MAEVSPVPQSVQIVSIRPLNKGMYLDRPAQQLESGAFVDLNGFIANLEGIKRRPAYQSSLAGDTVGYRQVDCFTVWGSDGTQRTLLLTDKVAYQASWLTGLDELAWVYDTGTATVSGGVTVVGSGTSWATGTYGDEVRVGDLFRVGTEEAVIATVTDDTHLALETAITNGVGLSYSIQRAFGGADGTNPLLDWAMIDNCVAIADGRRPLVRYDPLAAVGSQLSLWTLSTDDMPLGVECVPACVCAFLDRLWVGYTVDSIDGVQRQRIRWSALADSADFSITTSYIDLPYTNGAIRRLVPLGPYLFAYTDDAVYIGTQTNNSLLPVRFDLIDTGGIGIVGPKAVCPYLGGHCFIGQDDIYVMTTDGANKIGTWVIGETLRNCRHPTYCYAIPDPTNYRILFGFPQNQPYVQVIWSFDYRSKSWSYELTDTEMMANPAINYTSSWDSFAGDFDDATLTWSEAGMFGAQRSIFVERESGVCQLTRTGALDVGTEPISATFETADYDFGVADVTKVATRFNVKIEPQVTLTLPVMIRMEVSVNRGRTWKYIGLITIPSTRDEGYVNFAATGSTMRFRGTTNSAVGVYYISEYGIRVRSCGDELAINQ